MRHAFWLPAGNVVKDQVVELMLEDTESVCLWQALKELWIVDQLEALALFVEHYPSSGDTSICPLFNPPAKSSEERLFKQQVSKMFVEVKAHLSLSLSFYTTDTVCVKFFIVCRENKTQHLAGFCSLLGMAREIMPLD